jgi:RTX calcium-binding nonapeptide repeat (4 copies)
MRSHLLRACPVERKPHQSRWSGTATPRSQRPRGRPATAFHPRGWGPRVTTRSTHQVRRHHLGARRRRHDPGMDGNDRICGGEDDDDIYGDPGNDRLFRGTWGRQGGGGAGEDLLEEPAADREPNVLLGGSGDEVSIDGGSFSDSIDGEGGDAPFLVGNGGNDFIHGARATIPSSVGKASTTWTAKPASPLLLRTSSRSVDGTRRPSLQYAHASSAASVGAECLRAR